MLKRCCRGCRNAGLISHEDANKIAINGKSVALFEVGDKTITDEALEQEMATEKNFKVVREHELREIVWALHGAGRVFQSASEKVAEMLNYKEREVKGRIKSVKRELAYVQNNLAHVDDLVCLKQFIFQFGFNSPQLAATKLKKIEIAGSRSEKICAIPHSSAVVGILRVGSPQKLRANEVREQMRKF